MRRANGAAVLNIGRMGPGRQQYYLDAVAVRDGIDDYYLAKGEEPGRWLGTGAAQLGLGGRVTGEQLHRVLDGTHPDTGETLASHPARKVPGFDLTFRAPKSVSLLWGLSDRAVGREVATAHDAAVAAALAYLEQKAGWTRRGAQGGEAVRVRGFVGAAFRHRTSRADDPLLHTHVLVANLAETADDGVWRTLDSRRLYAHARTAGFLYQAHLRHELTARLGVAWGPVTNGCADLAGIPREWVDAFSRRCAQILQRLDERGETSARAAQVATLETRQAKGERLSEAELRDRWWQHATRETTIRRSWFRPLLGRAAPRPMDLAQLRGDLVATEGLTQESSTFTERDVVRAVAERLPTGARGRDIVAAARTLLDDDRDRVVHLGPTRGHLARIDSIRRRDDAVVPADADEPRFTTRGLLLLEQHAVNHAVARAHEGTAVVASANLTPVLQGRGLSDEQATMVRRLTMSGAGVEVVVGRAGTGKTYALDAARHAWQAQGIRVTGTAVAARAALELQDAAGIPSMTLARLLRRLEDGRVGSPLAPGSVLMVDEAGMVGTRHLARLLNYAEQRQVKVVLVGDTHQLPEIDAGGLFRALANRLPAVELTENRRQRQPWEVAALHHLRHGSVPAAVDAYRSHGRVVTVDDADDLRERLVADWWNQHEAALDQAATMIALRRADVDDLNDRARVRMAAAGRLHGPELQIGGRCFRAGDHVVCLRNERRLRVVNGTRATVTDVDLDEGRLEVTTDRGRTVVLPHRYLTAGHLTHGYAITGHKAQGLTVDHTFVLGSAGLYREWGYTAMSRGRESNRMYVHAGAYEDLDLDRHAVEPPADPVVSLTHRLTTSRAEVSLATMRTAEEWRDLHVRLASHEVEELDRWTDRRADLLRHARSLEARLAEVDDRLASMGRVRRRKERSDFVATRHRLALALQLRIRDLEAADQVLAQLPSTSHVERMRKRHEELDGQLRQVVQDRTRAVLTEPPAYLVRALGPPPAENTRRAAWIRAARTIEDHRVRWGVEDTTRALGDVALDPHQDRARATATARVNVARRTLGLEPPERQMVRRLAR